MLRRLEQLQGGSPTAAGLLHEVLVEAAVARLLRTDTGSEELLSCCQHPLAGAADLEGFDAVGWLVELALAALRPPS